MSDIESRNRVIRRKKRSEELSETETKWIKHEEESITFLHGKLFQKKGLMGATWQTQMGVLKNNGKRTAEKEKRYQVLSWEFFLEPAPLLGQILIPVLLQKRTMKCYVSPIALQKQIGDEEHKRMNHFDFAKALFEVPVWNKSECPMEATPSIESTWNPEENSHFIRF